MEQFYYFAADGRRPGPLPLSILKRLAQGEQIAPETTLEAEDGRRFRADEKLAAADFGGRTTAQEVDGASEKRKWDDAKFWLLALGVGLATICVMGATLGFASLAALFLGGVITTIILAPVWAPILAFAGCFDAKINRE